MNTNTNSLLENNQNEPQTSASSANDVRRGTNGKVPGVSRMDKPKRKRNNGDEMPGVRIDSPHGETGKVQSSKNQVVVRLISDLNPVEKIELLNAYKAIHNSIPETESDSWIAAIIRDGYQEWIDGKIMELFGESKIKPVAPGQFTEAETIALKALAQAIHQKKQAPAAPTRAAPPQQRQVQQPVSTERYIKAQEDFLQQLAQMEREGPEF